MGLKVANKTSFTGGWTGEKLCSRCSTLFIATSGSQKTCSNCRKCKECSKPIRYSHNKFCSIACASSWNYKNNDKIANIIKEGRQKAYTPEAREKISLAHAGKPKFNMRGSNNPNWKDGISRKERHTLMGQIEYKNWRKAVFERDDYTCQFCNIRGGNLEADHIIPYYINKDKALDINNGRTLCKSCHRTTDSWGHKVKTQYKLREAS